MLRQHTPHNGRHSINVNDLENVINNNTKMKMNEKIIAQITPEQNMHIHWCLVDKYIKCVLVVFHLIVFEESTLNFTFPPSHTWADKYWNRIENVGILAKTLFYDSEMIFKRSLSLSSAVFVHVVLCLQLHISFFLLHYIMVMRCKIITSAMLRWSI